VRAIGGLLSGLGQIGLAGFGISAISSALSGLTSGLLGDAMEAQKIASATDAVLASTKGVAGMSAQAINDLANGLSRVTPFEDEAVQGAENLLLTFTNIGKDIFPQVTETALNMSQALGQDLKSSSIQLGKAMQDPVAGATALRRVGVMLTDSQMTLIKSLMASGDLMGAQKVILGELATEFGGAARAAGETFTGKLAILQTQLGNVKETIGGALLPVLTGLLGAVMPLVIGFGDWLPGAIKVASGAIDNIIGMAKSLAGYLDPGNKVDLMRQWFGADLGPKIDEVVRKIEGIGSAIGETFGKLRQGDLGGFVKNLAGVDAQILIVLGGLGSTILGWIAGQLPAIWTQMQTWGAALWGWVQPMIAPTLAALGTLASQIWAWIQAQAPLWLAQLATWGNALWAWIQPMIPPVLAALSDLANQAWAWVQSQAPVWLAQLQTWGAALWGWISPMIPPLLTELGKLAAGLWEWISAHAAPLLAKFGEWASAFVAWIVPAATDFLARWPTILNDFLDWIGTAAVPLLSKLGEWALAFVGWILPMMPGFLLALAGILLGITAFILETAGTIGLKILQWGLAFVEWVVPMLPKLAEELGKLATAILDWIEKTALPFLKVQIAKWVPVFVDWIKDVVPKLAGELGKILDGIIQWVSNVAIPELGRQAAKLADALTPKINVGAILGGGAPSGGTGGGAAGGGGGSGTRASGGPVWPGSSYLVGEYGPELFRTPTAGSIMPSGPTQRMLGAGQPGGIDYDRLGAAVARALSGTTLSINDQRRGTLSTARSLGLGVT
jgi:Prophage tail length tape measure protein